MKLICPNCRAVRMLDVQAQQEIVRELSALPRAARKIIACDCGLGEWVFGLADLRPDVARTAVLLADAHPQDVEAPQLRNAVARV